MSQVAAEKLHAEKLQVSDDDGVYAPWPDGVDIEVRTTKQRTWARSVMSCGCGTCRVAFVARYVPCGCECMFVCLECVCECDPVSGLLVRTLPGDLPPVIRRGARTAPRYSSILYGESAPPAHPAPSTPTPSWVRLYVRAVVGFSKLG